MSELKTCFKRVDYDLDGLLHYIDIGDIGLPDIQRPFVWSNAKVRDLLDSMYRISCWLPSVLGKSDYCRCQANWDSGQSTQSSSATNS